MWRSTCPSSWKGGKVSRGRIGVVIQEVNEDLAESFGLDSARCAGGQIQDDGPAAKGGLKSGDVILSMNGRDVERSAQLPARHLGHQARRDRQD